MQESNVGAFCDERVLCWGFVQLNNFNQELSYLGGKALFRILMLLYFTVFVDFSFSFSFEDNTGANDCNKLFFLK